VARALVSRTELMNKVAVLLGGRAAETLVFDELSTGAADDIAKAISIARDMVMRYGMDDALCCVSYVGRAPRFLDLPGGAPERGSEASPETAQRIDAAVHTIVQTALDNASTLLRANRLTLDRCAQAQLDKETLDEAEISALASDLRRQPIAPASASLRSA
jgi:cell division protease FtsH